MVTFDNHTLLDMAMGDLRKPAVGQRVSVILKNGQVLQGDVYSYGYSENENPKDGKHLLCDIVLDNVRVNVMDVKELKSIEG